VKFGVQGVRAFNGSDDVALHDVPDGNTEFAGHGHGGFVVAAAHRYGQAPLLQRVVVCTFGALLILISFVGLCRRRQMRRASDNAV
jgi:hypothetical protein